MRACAGLFIRILAALLVVGLLGACQQMGPTEYGVRFRKLPPALGGGVSESLIRPGEMVAVMPWESIYRFDTSPQDASWGAQTRGKSEHDDYVYTRALDGNEVALAVTIRYRVRPEPDKLFRMVQEVATSDEEVRELVVSAGRADIRTFMNELPTSEFIDTESRYLAVDKVGKSISDRLDKKYGIEILQVKLDDFRFERVLRDGTTDASYQERLTQVQKLREDTERERSRIDAVRAKKQQEFNNTQATVNRVVAEATGNLKQAELRGNAYYETRSNEAEAILARGRAEVEGLIEQVNALSGPGGLAILRLELARQLQNSDAKFVVLGEGSGGQSLDVKRVDTNQLLQQIGVLEALGADKPRPAPAVAPKTSDE